jgi:hypothetical protein
VLGELVQQVAGYPIAIKMLGAKMIDISADNAAFQTADIITRAMTNGGADAEKFRECLDLLSERQRSYLPVLGLLAGGCIITYTAQLF